MKIALVTTTINVPEVLREYRRLDRNVPFLIVGDQKSPHNEIEELCSEIGKANYYGPEDQEALYPELSAAIGWNNVQRRNIGILEAAKLEPDLIVSIDDDNWPTGAYFHDIRHAFASPHYGYLADGEWFNIGGLASQEFTYRGYPFREVPSSSTYHANGRKHEIGILNGLIFGDPDVNAAERIKRNPKVRTYSRAAQAGISVHPTDTWTPINAQNTVYLAELAPLMLQLPRVGRYDDIWGSYIAQSVLMDTDLHVHFGKPFVMQKRNDHDLQKDLAEEEYGSKWSLYLSQCLRSTDLKPGTVLERLRSVLRALEKAELDLPFDFFDAWLRAWE